MFALVALVVLFSCKKDDDPTPYDAKYTTETTEQSKAKVEQNAIDFVDQLNTMSSATAIEVMMNLNSLQQPVYKSTATKTVLKPLSLIASLKGQPNVASVFDGLKTAEGMMETNPVSIGALFDSIAGKYTYNFTTYEFDYSELADKVVIEFPGKETDNTNTASITIDNFAVKEITAPAEGWPEGLAPELPTSLKVDLKYNGASIAGSTFAASYQNDGMPTKVTIQLWLDNFTFTTTAVHSPYSSASWKNSLKYNSEILLETYIAASGNWSEQNLNSDPNIQDVLKKANAYWILMNLEVAGQVNVKGLADAANALQENPDITSQEEYITALVDIINNNADLVVIYRDSNTKIAEAEAYVASEYDDYYETTDYYPAMRFVYADGSVVDPQTFVTQDLDNFYDAVNEFIDTLNSEYGLNIDYVYPPYPAK